MPLAALNAVEVDYPGRGRALGPFSLTLEPGEIARAVKEIVVFDGGSSDISHLGNANRL